MNMAEPSKKDASDNKAESPTQEIVARLTPFLKPEKRREAEQVVGMILHKSHSGPLPCPEDLAHYDAISPGAANRIIAMAESNMVHRHTMESAVVRSEYGLRTRGQWLAILALLAMLSVIVFAFWIGQPIAAGVLGSATLISVTGMFLNREKEAVEEKQSPPKVTKNRTRRK
jgi:uncharacterized membrane protein